MGGKLIVSSTTVRNAEGSQHELLNLDGDCQIAFDGAGFIVDTGKESFPCVCVSWYGAQVYCHYRSILDGVESCLDLDRTGVATSRRAATACLRRPSGRERLEEAW